MPTSKLPADIQAVFDRVDAALLARDLDKLATAYAEDVQFFDVMAQGESFQTLRETWEMCFPHIPIDIVTERRNLTAFVGSDVAVITYFSRLKGLGDAIPAAAAWLRSTSTLQKINGDWKIVHDHVSYPTDCEQEKPVYLGDDDLPN